jgi:hypothetical protein
VLLFAAARVWRELKIYDALFSLLPFSLPAFLLIRQYRSLALARRAGRKHSLREPEVAEQLNGVSDAVRARDVQFDEIAAVQDARVQRANRPLNWMPKVIDEPDHGLRISQDDQPVIGALGFGN